MINFSLDITNLQEKSVNLSNTGSSFSVFCKNEYTVTPYSEFLLNNLKGIKTNHLVLDFGSGTGVIAITCSLLKAKHVFAYDSNKLGLALTKINVKKNNLKNITVLENKKSLLKIPQIDLIISNPPSLPCNYKTSDFFYGGFYGTDTIFELIDTATVKLKKGGKLQFIQTSLVCSEDVHRYLKEKNFTFKIKGSMHLEFRRNYFKFLEHFKFLKSQGKSFFIFNDNGIYIEVLYFISAIKA